jgi:hypothetical protein
MILTAGPISVTYDSGTLRYIRCGGVEVLRQIYVALRDSRWGTIPGRVSGESIAQGADWFRIEFTVTHRQGEIAFAWDGCIEGRQDGTIRFAMSGGASSSFLANRIGFCVLHPIENVEPDEIPELDILRPGRIARFQLLNFSGAHAGGIQEYSVASTARCLTR